MEFRITGIAFQIIKDDHVVFLWFGIQIGEQRHHSGAVHKIAAARCIIRKYSFDMIAFTFRIFTAAMLLAFKASPIS
nr:hypothetical protein [Roseibium sp. TrichSKD4]